jgi:hypothetical protein
MIFRQKMKSSLMCSTLLLTKLKGVHVSKYVERIYACGCGESFMARASDVARGQGRYKSRSHATRGPNNPHWINGLSKQHQYVYKARSVRKHRGRHLCRRAYESAIRAGILKRGCCEFCGNPRSEGHTKTTASPTRCAGCARNIIAWLTNGVDKESSADEVLSHSKRKSRCPETQAQVARLRLSVRMCQPNKKPLDRGPAVELVPAHEVRRLLREVRGGLFFCAPRFESSDEQHHFNRIVVPTINLASFLLYSPDPISNAITHVRKLI